MAAVIASLVVFTGLVTLTTPSRIPLVVFQRFDIHRVTDLDDATMWPLEEIAPDTRQYSHAEPRILYQVGGKPVLRGLSENKTKTKSNGIKLREKPKWKPKSKTQGAGR
ncbi:hypothetical protein RUM44_006054 [Polyplax serrata]|uniref:Uncharacterized protein n=1 Tax=Polyplax serrata TaxID=468196 RepID=A0ABR1AZB0_POLSC